MGTQDTGRRQTKPPKKHNLSRKAKTISNTDQPKTGGMFRCNQYIYNGAKQCIIFSECTTGTYGVNREIRCDACVDKMCESRNGNYTYGCIEGYKGVRCKLSGILRLAPG